MISLFKINQAIISKIVMLRIGHHIAINIIIIVINGEVIIIITRIETNRKNIIIKDTNSSTVTTKRRINFIRIKLSTNPQSFIGIRKEKPIKFKKRKSKK